MDGGISAWTRRDVLRAGGLGALGLAAARASSEPGRRGGPAVIAPDARRRPEPARDVRPQARRPGRDPRPVRLDRDGRARRPRLRAPAALAAMMDRLTLIRSLGHDSAPIHETGLQLLQTGRLCRGDGPVAPHVGAVGLAPVRFAGRRAAVGRDPPGPIGHTGVAISHGQSAGVLGSPFEPAVLGPEVDAPGADLDAYGPTEFGRSCLRARSLVESGVRFVTVNMYRTVFGQVSWDCHGLRPFATLADYRDTVLPTFDRAFSALVGDLDRLGLLDSTLVVAAGEFGRTPRLNAAGGRDHWPSASSAVLAGGGFSGGRVIGATDAHAAEVVNRPFSPAELVATMQRHLGIDPIEKFWLGTPGPSAGSSGPAADRDAKTARCSSSVRPAFLRRTRTSASPAPLILARSSGGRPSNLARIERGMLDPSSTLKVCSSLRSGPGSSTTDSPALRPSLTSTTWSSERPRVTSRQSTPPPGVLTATWSLSSYRTTAPIGHAEHVVERRRRGSRPSRSCPAGGRGCRP